VKSTKMEERQPLILCSKVAMEFIDGGALTDVIFANENLLTEGHISWICWQVHFYLDILCSCCISGSWFSCAFDRMSYLLCFSVLIRVSDKFGQVLLGLEYLHSRPRAIIHRDIKSDNILMGLDGACRISSFLFSLCQLVFTF
jgi:serine/threonine protein kinase